MLVWLQDRKQTEVFWIAISDALIALAMLGRVTLPFLVAVVIVNIAISFSFGLVWTSFRSLRGRRPRADLILLPAMIWFGCYLIPVFRSDSNLRIGLSLLLLLIPVSLTARELWLMRDSSPIIRWPVFVVLVLQLLLMFQRSVRFLVWPGIAHLSFEAVPGFDMLMIDLIFIMSICNFSVIAMVKDKTVRWYYDKARFDFLTNVGNRLYFEECLLRHFDRADNVGQPLSLIMIDADLFKDYNDVYGHPAGDSCLQKLANALVACTRPSDIVARYGGEEFIALLPNTDCNAAVAIAERMRHQVRGLGIPQANRPDGRMTISLGVACYSSLLDNSSRLTAKNLVEAADMALYKAKHLGRDRLYLAESSYKF